MCQRPFSQARDTGRLGLEEHAESNLRRSDYLEKEKRWCCSCIKMGIMRLRNGSTNEYHQACFKNMICVQDYVQDKD
jgi:hypothetical protein